MVRADPPIREVVVDFAGVNFIDSQGTGLIDRLLDSSESIGVGLRLARAKPDVRPMLAADGVEDRLAASRLHANLGEAVDAGDRQVVDRFGGAAEVDGDRSIHFLQIERHRLADVEHRPKPPARSWIF